MKCEVVRARKLLGLWRNTLLKPLGLYVCPEDGGSGFSRNFDGSLRDYTTSQRNAKFLMSFVILWG
jgi:hypothetical protein